MGQRVDSNYTVTPSAVASVSGMITGDRVVDTVL